MATFQKTLLAAQNGNPETQYELGEMLYFGQGIKQDYTEAIKWYRKSAEQGNSDAQYSLGFMYERGHGVEEDYEEAIKWYRLAAEQGSADAQYELGFMYEYGQGVEEDYEEAIKWYRLAAEQGNADAQYQLGLIYAIGQGVKQNYKEATKWYRLAAEQDNSDAQYELGDMLYIGQGIKQDYEEAIKWYRKSAEQENSDAQYSLGFMYNYGQGVNQNYEEAAKWYRLAADQGNADGQYRLGLLYAIGQGVKQNYKEATKWYRLAAEQGSADAQYLLGLMYTEGKGVELDFKKAEKLFSQAAAQDYADAKSRQRWMQQHLALPQSYAEVTKNSEKMDGHFVYVYKERVSGKIRYVGYGKELERAIDLNHNEDARKFLEEGQYAIEYAGSYGSKYIGLAVETALIDIINPNLNRHGNPTDLRFYTKEEMEERLQKRKNVGESNYHFVYVYRDNNKKGKVRYVGYGKEIERASSRNHSKQFLDFIDNNKFTLKYAGPYESEQTGKAVETALIGMASPDLNSEMAPGPSKFQFRPLGIPEAFASRLSEPRLTINDLITLGNGQAVPILFVKISDRDFEDFDPRRGYQLDSPSSDADILARMDSWWQIGKYAKIWKDHPEQSAKVLVGIAGTPAHQIIIGAVAIDPEGWKIIQPSHGQLYVVPLMLKNIHLDAYGLRGRLISPDVGIRFGAIRSQFQVLLDSDGKIIGGQVRR